MSDLVESIRSNHRESGMTNIGVNDVAFMLNEIELLEGEIAKAQTKFDVLLARDTDNLKRLIAAQAKLSEVKALKSYDFDEAAIDGSRYLTRWIRADEVAAILKGDV